jgi:predicted alpha/beta-fold hydrolase
MSKTPTELQEKSGKVASSFPATTSSFDPYISNGHLQTIFGSYLKDTCSYLPRRTALFSLAFNIFQFIISSIFGSSSKETVWTKRERIETPDGDWFHVDSRMTDKYTTGKAEDAPWVVVCHGLESSSESSLSQEMAVAFNDIGMNCVCLNYRSCSGEPNNILGCYHFGFTNDLQQYINIMRNEHAITAPIYLSGFSLGANLVLYFLGRLGADAVKQNIHAGAVLCAPLDQVINQPILGAEGINRKVYSANILKSLKARVQTQLDQLCDGDENTKKFDYKKAMAAETIMDFDAAFTAPIYGFKDCWDYYQQTSSIHFLEDIQVPVLIINAKNDPFF